jgi:phosphatidylserine decarboxylase
VGLNTISTVVFKEGFKNIPHKDTPKKVKKGDELGYFQYGGSLLISYCLNPAVSLPESPSRPKDRITRLTLTILERKKGAY